MFNISLRKRTLNQFWIERGRGLAFSPPPPFLISSENAQIASLSWWWLFLAWTLPPLLKAITTQPYIWNIQYKVLLVNHSNNWSRVKYIRTLKKSVYCTRTYFRFIAHPYLVFKPRRDVPALNYILGFLLPIYISIET